MSFRSLTLTSAILILAACGASDAAKPEATATELPDDVREVASVAEPAPSGETATIVDAGGETPGSFAATGDFRSPVTSQIAPRLPGRVEEVYVDAGQAIRRGQPLLKLETQYVALEAQQASAQLQQARAALAEATSDFQRKKELFDKGSIPRATYDRSASMQEQAAASVAAANASLQTARTRANDSTMYAPFDGVVVERRTAVGERLQDASVAFVIAQTAPLDLRFQLPERLLPQVRKGQPVRASVDAYPGVAFEGHVDVVGQTVDPATRSFFVEASFPNADRRLRPGMFAQVVIDLR